MRAAVMRRAGDVRFEEVPDPKIIDPTDAIIRLSSSCICGSDLWPYGKVFDRTLPLAQVADGYREMDDRRAIKVLLQPQSDLAANRRTAMSDNDRKTAPTALAAFAPKLAELTDQVLFGDVWERPQLSKRDRSLITCAALVALGKAEQMTFHFPRAVENGVTREELVELITHLAFYAGWPNAISAATRAQELLQKKP
jgi:4-carboxymuconolactone decarboxylase